jgi:hypothetical protein
MKSRICFSKTWSAVAALDWSAWAVGFGFDTAPYGFWIDLGPVSVGIEQDDSTDAELWTFGLTLYRIVIRKWKLEVRFDFDLNIWKLGYVMADRHDHGIYLGPFNVQIEYDKFYNHPTIAWETCWAPSFGYANLYPETTGLPMTVWVSARGTAQHNARVRVNTTHGRRTNLKKTAVVTLRPGPRLFSGRLSLVDGQTVFAWAWLNTDALLEYWCGQIDTAELVRRLKPAPSSTDRKRS